MLIESDSHSIHMSYSDIENAKSFMQINIVDYVNFFNAFLSMCISNAVMECLETGSKVKSSIKETSNLELKSLPSHLCYVFLGERKTLPFIFSSSLN